MVTKPPCAYPAPDFCLNLAKIHMVTKLEEFQAIDAVGLNLAKIHMVTKQREK